MFGEWRPIETAPKDGTIIDLWCIHPAYKSERAADAKFKDNGWVFGFFSEKLNTGWYPTHWMSLPPPPSDGG